jgi:uncharacterized protein (TIGR00299 family) protein
LDIHLDPLGGWSGDMFVAALLDAFPEHLAAVERAVASLGLGPEAAVRLVAHRDAAGLTGRRFLVRAEDVGDRHEHGGHHHHGPDGHHHGHGHPDDQPHSHGHRAWSTIRALIEGSPLDARVKREAVAIFEGLAEAEGQVHGVPPDEVTFHEVGAVDSIVDVVAAAQLIALVDAERWTASALPLGSGRVRTAHGILPVPAPATALLLRGLDTIDDGIPGERVTPTGAAVARHLLLGSGKAAPRPRRMSRSGTGFGTREMAGISNCLRALAFEPAAEFGTAAASQFSHRELGVITFEVDDLSAEDLSNGLDHVRAMPGVHDVVQAVVFGKKGRVATQVQVLVAPDRLDDAIRLCFAETTTIGLRFGTVQGAALPRGFDTVQIDGRDLRTKHVTRPDGSRTAKAEASDVSSASGHAERLRLRREAEAQALSRLDRREPRP